MGFLSIEKLIRYVVRALRVYTSSTDPKIKVGGEPLEAAYQEFKAANRQVKRCMKAVRKERKESESALILLASEIDSTASTIALRRPNEVLPGRSGSFATPDDILQAADEIEEILLNVGGVDEDHPLDGTSDAAPTGEEWARTLLREFQPVYSAAAKEYEEAVNASADLQKARARRAVARGELEQKLYGFRRLVRDVYGTSSREYLMLMARAKRGSAEEAEEDATLDEGADSEEPDTEDEAATTSPEPEKVG